jgi:hypothetical protein
MYSFKNYTQLLSEGGAGGHMAHPFEVPTVTTGNDLIDLFVKTENYLETAPAALKVDGINLSVRLINSGTRTEFAIDRGTNKEIDKQGVTIDKLEQRFSSPDPETGQSRPNLDLILKCKLVLTILNNALPEIKEQLKQLNLVDTERYINLEFVEKKSNVITYDKNFLVLHNIKEFTYGLTPKTKKATRIKIDAEYNKKAMFNLVETLKPFAAKAGFAVYHEITAELKTVPDYEKVLTTPFTIKISDGVKDTDTETKTLFEWLNQLPNPLGTKVRFLNGLVRDAISKEAIYVQVVQGRPLSEFIEPDSFAAAKAGAVFYHATRMLGNELLSNIDTPFGLASKQEGIVINSPRVAPIVFKITGQFILDSLLSPFHKSTTNAEKTIVFTYGRFNPPTIGHEVLLKRLEEIGRKHRADLVAVFPSHTYDVETDPLPFDVKVEALNAIVPNNVKVMTEGKTFFAILKYLTEQGYTKAVQVAGSDRLDSFSNLVERYNGQPDKNGKITFSIPDYTFETSGIRDPDAEGMAGVSASKIRKAALENDKAAFDFGIARSLRAGTRPLSDKIFLIIRGQK